MALQIIFQQLFQYMLHVIRNCQAQPQFNFNSIQFNSIEAEIALFQVSVKPPAHQTHPPARKRSYMDLCLHSFRSIQFNPIDPEFFF